MLRVSIRETPAESVTQVTGEVRDIELKDPVLTMWRMALTRMTHNELKSACKLHSVSDDGTVKDLAQRLGELSPCDEQVALFASNPRMHKAEVLFWVRESHLREQASKSDAKARAEARTSSKSDVLPVRAGDLSRGDGRQPRQPPPRPPSASSQQPPAALETGNADIVARQHLDTQPDSDVQTTARGEVETEGGAEGLNSASDELGTKRAVAKRRRSSTQKSQCKRRRDNLPSPPPSSLSPPPSDMLEQDGFGWCCVPCKLWMPEGDDVCLKCGRARSEPTNSNTSNQPVHQKKDSRATRKRTKHVTKIHGVSTPAASKDVSPEADWCCDKCKVWMPSSQHTCVLCHQPPDQNHGVSDPGIPETSSFSAVRVGPSSSRIDSDPALPSKRATPSSHSKMTASAKRTKPRAKKVHRPITKRGTSRPESAPKSTTAVPSQPNTVPDTEQKETVEQVSDV